MPGKDVGQSVRQQRHHTLYKSALPGNIKITMKLETKLFLDYYAGGLLHVILKPLVWLAGKIMHRDHDLGKVREIAVLKLLGGGSLVIAYPALLGLREAMPDCKLKLIATRGTQIYANELGIFDEILVMDDSAPLRILSSGLRAARRLFACDCIIDLEVHSRLSTVFTLLTCARNRMGFYTESGLWRRYIYTHLLYFNNHAGVFYFYDQIPAIFGGACRTLAETRDLFRKRHGLGSGSRAPRIAHVALAPCCSGLGRSRMLGVEEWAVILLEKRKTWQENCNIHILGGGGEDVAFCETLRGVLEKCFPNGSGIFIHNAAGRFAMHETLACLERADVLYSIDSGLLHLARLLGLATESYWGPTAPLTRLKEIDPQRDIIHYAALPCSPCVHMTDRSPCHGNNLCMQMHTTGRRSIVVNPAWLDRSSAKVEKRLPP
jgi:ADP-heptose:LPS heptosyltransferase